jgi:penicillin-binding protein 2
MSPRRPRSRRRSRVQRLLGRSRPLRPTQLPPRSSQVVVEDVSSRSTAQVASERTGSRINFRTRVLAAIVLGLILVLLFRLWTLQLDQGSVLGKLSETTTTRTITVPGPRGLILADDGKTMLAGDTQETVASITTTFNPSEERVGSAKAEANLAALIPGLSVAEIKAAVGNSSLSPYQPVVVTPPLSPGQITYIEEHSPQFPGVSVTQIWERTYPFGSLAAQTLGYVAPISQSELTQLSKDGYTSSDNVGQFGLEAEYEDVLQGKASKQTVVVDPSGNVVSQLTSTPSVSGDNLVLNMNVGLEETATTALSNEIAT